ncbi:hypothetical protein [Mucilaginibacter corticis]|nr:hypothetical protein [Mucilaginibacter corticis]
MKNIILTAITVLSLGILSSCAKKGNVPVSFTVFSNMSYSAKTILATAD